MIVATSKSGFTMTVIAQVSRWPWDETDHLLLHSRVVHVAAIEHDQKLALEVDTKRHDVEWFEKGGIKVNLTLLAPLSVGTN